MAKKKSENVSQKRETRVLLEEIHSDVKKIAEGHGALAAKLDEHDNRFDAIDKRFDMVEAAVSENSREIKYLQADAKQIKEKLDTVLIGHEDRIKKLELVK